MKAKIYNSIDELPIYNWRKINETNDLNFLVIKGKAKDDELIEVFEKIKSEFIDTFGISDSYREILLCQRDIAVMKADMVINDDPFIQNFIDMRMIDLANLSKQTSKSGFNETKVHVEKFLGFRINEREVTVKEYYSYIEVIKQQNKAA